jgi:hypothetical protein
MPKPALRLLVWGLAPLLPWVAVSAVHALFGG